MSISDRSTSNHDSSAVQERLLQMLQKVQADQPAAPSDSPDSGCPNCHSTDSWGTSPWCPKCGFYPKLNRVMQGVVESPEEAAPAASDAEPTEHDTEHSSRMQDDPAMSIGWLLVAFALFVPAAILSALYFLHIDLQGLVRTAQAAAGLAEQARVQQGEPETEQDAASESDGDTASTAKSSSRLNRQPANASTAAAAGTEAGDSRPFAPQEPHRRDLSELVVFGFTTNAYGEMRAVLVAQISGSRGRFAGRLATEATRPEIVATLTQQLAGIRTNRPAVDCPYGANWVKPVLVCRVAHDGWTPDGRIHDGEIVALLAR